MKFLRIIYQYRLSLVFLIIFLHKPNKGNNTLLKGLYFQSYGLRESRGCLTVGLSFPRSSSGR